MMYAYGESYLDDAMKNLGEAFDYAVNSCNMEADAFADLFIAGGIAEQFGNGVPKYVSGMSGTELVWEIVRRSGSEEELPEAAAAYDCSPEYWCGWILAYYQWYTGRSFKNIKQHISMREILKLYPTLHEAAEERFTDTLNSIIRRKSPPTQLQLMRRASGYSQKQLAQRSGVALRMIQQYEQRAKHINKASARTLLMLARSLGCRMDDLMEPEEGGNEEKF